MLRNFIITVLLILPLSGLAQQTKSPQEYLGYALGERFTRHHAVIDYFKHVTNTNENVGLITYGETYEYRPLVVAVVSSPENMANLDEIRLNNLRRTGLSEGEVEQDDIAIVWLSYNIHGNEASSTEAAMKTLYDLIDPDNSTTKEWLKNTIVVIDPCVNPDGRDRYANFYNQFSDRNYNPSGHAMEHREPWPGGRPNHYLFDLNRDWAWQTQKESEQRSRIYHEWMPHVHVDFHEQGYNSPYYFAPAAEPFHEVITPWQREFQTEIGKNNASYFDKEGWLYFTKQRFDLLYPSYGDTYPTYNGAIGMTYEQAGHGFAGLGVITEYDDTLKLTDRVAHHHTTSMATIEVSSKNANRLSREFEKYFENILNNPETDYKSYIISKDNEPDKINKLLNFLDKHNIQYGLAPTGGRGISGFDYINNRSNDLTISRGDILVPVHQPMGNLVSVLFEPQTALSDSLTYDITAWSLPYAYGLKAYASTTQLNIAGDYQPSPPLPVENVERAYAYIAKYNSFEDAKYLAYLLKNNINVRVSNRPFTINGKNFNGGSLIITRRTNELMGSDFDRIIKEGATRMGRSVMATSSGMVDLGADFGSSDVGRLVKPRVGVVAGDQVSSLAFGEIWYFFEQELQYPVTNIRTDYFKSIDLSDYDVLVFPSGNYSLLNEETLKKLNEWVKAGGKLVAGGNALKSFAGAEGFGLLRFANEELKKEHEEQEKEIREEEILLPYEDSERIELNRSIFGAIYKVRLDNTHPLAYGYPEDYFSLKTSENHFAFLPEGGNVGVLQDNVKPVSGYAGQQANQNLNNSLVFGVEKIGGGNVVYLVDDPLFRAFWENGKLLFANAIFMVGQ